MNSVAALSILTITSRHHAHLSCASLILHHSRPAARLIPAPAHQNLASRDHGTRVTVQDLFGNMPVRVKQRALGDENRKGDEKQLEALKKHIVGLLLAWDNPVSVTLKSSEGNKKTSIRIKETTPDREQQEISLRTHNVSIVCNILSQAKYIEPSDRDAWVKTSARTSSLIIKGAISLRPAPSKHVQFMSLGILPINAETNSNLLFDEVNRLFAASSFGEREDVSDTEEAGQTKKSKDRRFKQEGYTNRQLRGGGKGVDRWPMFYIRIERQQVPLIDQNGVDGLEEGTLSKIFRVLGAMIIGFLEENHFRPRARVKRGAQAHGTAQRAARVRGCASSQDFSGKTHIPKMSRGLYQDNIFTTWSRIKSGANARSSGMTCAPLCRQTNEEDGASTLSEILDIEPTEASSEPSAAKIAATIPTVAQDCDPELRWKNPVSGAEIRINARTGLTINPLSPRRPSSAPSNLLPSSFSPKDVSSRGKIARRTRLTRSISNPFVMPKIGSWSSDLLNKWENPIFSTPEQAIPSVSFDGPTLDACDMLHGRRHFCSDAEIDKAFKQSSLSLSAKLSRKALENADFIAQVDRKFILFRMSSSLHADGSQLLVLVDQHAADERTRIEGLLADLASSQTLLPQFIVFDIPIREHSLFSNHAAYFASWGICYELGTTLGSSKCKVTIKMLPTVVAERCRAEPKFLIDLLRREVWNREEQGSRSRTQSNALGPDLSPALENEGWLARLGNCPQGLIDMLNSRACRSAIMFNDELTREDCVTLIQKLAGCAFPFQCAHGRLSMVPLVDLGVQQSRVGGFGSGTMLSGLKNDRTNTEKEGFVEAWRKWKPDDDGSAGVESVSSQMSV